MAVVGRKRLSAEPNAMRIATAASDSDNTEAATQAVLDQLLVDLQSTPDLLIVYASADHDFQLLAREVSERAPGVAMQGASSCRGVMTDQGYFGAGGRGLGMLAIADADGSYGVGAARVGDDAADAGAKALLAALAQAGRSGEVPTMLWLSGPPGYEERVLRGIAGVVGDDVPVIGGSAADDAVEGRWQQLANGEVYQDAVVVVAMFPSTPLAFSFHSGYTPADRSGRVTSSHGRTVHTIDGRKAAVVYNEWTDGLIADELGGGSIFGNTTLAPLGRINHVRHGIAHYLLAHPETVTEDGGLSFFCELSEGDELHLMRGSVDSLVERAGRVAQASLSNLMGSVQGAPVSSRGSEERELAGALVVYCAGCMLTVQSELQRVVDGLRKPLHNKPFLGVFTFGEQGCLTRGDNRHGNLMISVVTFSRSSHG
jgi:hypothetical protein